MPATPQEQLSFVKTRMKDYFQQLAAISEKFPPPAVNAANGFWRNETVADPRLQELEGPPNIELSDEAAKFYPIFSNFQVQTRAAFQPENYEADWDTSLPLFWDVFKEQVGSIIDVVTDIYNLFSDDAEKQKAAKDKLFADIEALVKKSKIVKTRLEVHTQTDIFQSV